jgi:hypothetical protein
VDDDEDRTGDHGGERHQKGPDTGRQRHQSPPRFFAAPRAHDWAGRNVSQNLRAGGLAPILRSFAARRQQRWP